MRTKLKATFVKANAEKYLNARNEGIRDDYEKAIEKAMQPSLWNLWKGRNRTKAEKHLDNWNVKSTIYNSYMDMLEWKGGYHASIVQDAFKMSNLAISNGQQYVWINEDELFFLNLENLNDFR